MCIRIDESLRRVGQRRFYKVLMWSSRYPDELLTPVAMVSVSRNNWNYLDDNPSLYYTGSCLGLWSVCVDLQGAQFFKRWCDKLISEYWFEICSTVRGASGKVKHMVFEVQTKNEALRWGRWDEQPHIEEALVTEFQIVREVTEEAPVEATAK